MRDHFQRRRVVIATAGFVAAVVAGALTASRLGAQAPATQPAVPQWQTAAGGRMAFEVSSVKRNTAALDTSPPSSNVTLIQQGAHDNFTPAGGLFSVRNTPLIFYLVFAYKLTAYQQQSASSQLPKWAIADRFDIQARAAGNPSEDQLRLMMQTMLADRFKLAIHFEDRQLPAYAFVLSRAGKLGPQLQRHSDDPPCAAPSAKVPGGASSPAICDRFIGEMQPSGQLHMSARDETMANIADFSLVMGKLDRPVLDQTGLSGVFDFSIDFTPVLNGPPPSGATSQTDNSGPTFLEALRDQLGLKLESTIGPVEVLVIDHVEGPSPN
jgi:bla regulator protein BlaR1